MSAIVRRYETALRDSEAAVLMLLVATGGAASLAPNPTLGFITQMWVLGSIAGTAMALIRYRRHADDPRWALFVGAGALLGAAAGLLVAVLDAILW